MKRFFLYTLLSFFLLLPSAGQASANNNDSIRLSLLTCAPGEEIQNDGILLRGVLNQFLYERGGLGVTEHIVPEKFFFRLYFRVAYEVVFIYDWNNVFRLYFHIACGYPVATPVPFGINNIFV